MLEVTVLRWFGALESIPVLSISVKGAWIALFRRASQGGGVALCVRECFDCIEVNDCEDTTEASRSLALVLGGDFNIPNVCWKYDTAERE